MPAARCLVRLLPVSLLFGVCLAVQAQAPDATPPAETLTQSIDRLIAAQTPNYAQMAAPLADDAEFLRRVSLDLIGMPPTAAKAREFLTSTDPEKRVKLVDELVQSPEFNRELARKLDVMLMQRRGAQHVPHAEWLEFLRSSIAENKPWDQLVADILSVDGTDPKTRAAARFYLDRGGEVNEITRDVGRVFLGMNLECAQCHNHPHVDDYKQRHYYGLAAFLVRSSLFTEQGKAVLAENAVGEVKFESVFEIRDKVSPGPQTTMPRVLDLPGFEEPKFDFGQEYARAPAKDVRPIPHFSRRQLLAEALTDPSNRQFRRNIANRVWAMYLGRGLVHPLDYDHRDNPPSHPELLDLLGQNLEARGYNLRGLIRDIVLSNTYQRSSRPAESQRASEPPPPETFAVAPIRDLTAEQFAWAWMEASGVSADYRANLGDKLNEESFYKSLAGIEMHFINLFGGEPGKVSKGFEASIEQTLYLMNEPGVQGWTGSRLFRTLSALPAEQHKELADELYLSCLTRFPSEMEVQEVQAFLADVGDQRPQAIKDLIWALMTSAEFRFNH